MLILSLIQFDPTINIGTILTAISGILFVLKLHKTNQRRQDELERKVNLIYKSLRIKVSFKDYEDNEDKGDDE